MEDSWQRIKGQEHVKRVVEVALTGNHSLLLVGPPGNGKTLFRGIVTQANNQLNTAEAWPCPCGYHQHPVRICSCSTNMIDAHIANLHKRKYELFLEVPSLRFKEFNCTLVGEPFAAVEKRIKKAWKFLDGLKNPEIAPNAEKLLEMACDKLGFSARRLVMLIDVGKTIAALDSSKTIEAQHTSEALVYRS